MKDRKTLESWKEIAGYLNRSVMTCHRWEAELGLPVHRLDGTPKARVFAYTDELDRWKAEKQNQHEAVSAPRRKPVLLVALAALPVMITVMLLIWRPWTRGAGPSAFSSARPSISILQLANRTRQKDLDHYRDVLASLISFDLSQSKYIYVVPSDQVYSILTRLDLLEADSFTREDLRAIGRRGGGRYLASGFFTESDETFLVSLVIQEAESGRIIGTAEARGEGIKNLFALAEEVTARVKPLLELTAIEVANDIDRPLERVTTSSPEAYRYYLKAARLVGALKNREAIELLEKAVAIDPEFAMAYSNLATYHTNLENWVEWKKNADKALELSMRQDRLPLREKLLVEGMATRDGEDRIKAYSRLLELYPEDVMGNFLAGVVYNQLDEPEKAAERQSVLVRNRVEIPYPYNNLANAYCRLGDYAKAEMVLKGYIRDFPGHPAIATLNLNLANVYLVQGRFKDALAALEESSRLDPELIELVSRSRGAFLALMGDFDQADAELRGCLAGTDVPGFISINQDLARLNKARGRFRTADEDFRRALAAAEKNNLTRQFEELSGDIIENDLAAGDVVGAETMLSGLSARLQEQGQDPGTNSIWLVGKATVLLKKGEFEEAGRYVSDYAAIIEKGINQRAQRNPLRLQGIVELEKGNFETALGLLLRSKSLLWSQPSITVRVNYSREWHAFFMEPLALAYFRSGDLERARQEYEAITRLTTGRLAYGDLYARSFFMLGQIYEQLGKKRQARVHYHKFLDLWKDADPGLPEVEDARTRLDRLETR
jgi:pentatricopeptide repeat protein